MHVRNQEKVIILSYSWLKEAVLEEAGKGRGEEKEEDKNTVAPACKVNVLANENWPYKQADLTSRHYFWSVSD